MQLITAHLSLALSISKRDIAFLKAELFSSAALFPKSIFFLLYNFFFSVFLSPKSPVPPSLLAAQALLQAFPAEPGLLRGSQHTEIPPCAPQAHHLLPPLVPASPFQCCFATKTFAFGATWIHFNPSLILTDQQPPF